MTPLALRTTRLLTERGFAAGTVVLRAERVDAVLPHDAAPPDVRVEDVGDAVIMPGLVDSHVHVNEPGRTEWEGWESATRAAALGGVVALVDMPLNSIPVTTTVQALEDKIAATAGKLWIDAGFWGGVIPGNVEELAPMVAAGARGFKCFLCPSGIDEFPNVDAAELRRAMPVLTRAGVPLLVHAELESELRAAADADPAVYGTYLHSRPPEWEDAAVAMIVDLVRETGCPAHIVHLSSAGALAHVRAARREGLPLTAETCPHYLVLTAEEVPRGDTSFKCAPPIRPSANREHLWAALADGTLDFVVTDHSPCIPALKKLDTGNFLEAWGGIASLQLGLSSVWTEARRRGFSLSAISRWMTAGPARLAGLPHDALRVGAPADLVVFDPDTEWTVDVRALAHRNPVSPWHGRPLVGRVRHTFLRGAPVVKDGAVVGAPSGRPLRGPRVSPQELA
jgi:allantoinase